MQPKILEFFFIKSNGMNRFSVVDLTGMFTLEYFHWSGHFGRLDQNVPYHLTKFLLFPSTILLHPAYKYNN